MAMHDLVSLRVDKTTATVLKGLVDDYDYKKSEIVRRSIRLFAELVALKRKNGEVLMKLEDGIVKPIILI